MLSYDENVVSAAPNFRVVAAGAVPRATQSEILMASASIGMVAAAAGPLNQIYANIANAIGAAQALAASFKIALGVVAQGGNPVQNEAVTEFEAACIACGTESNFSSLVQETENIAANYQHLLGVIGEQDLQLDAAVSIVLSPTQKEEVVSRLVGLDESAAGVGVGEILTSSTHSASPSPPTFTASYVSSSKFSSTISSDATSASSISFEVEMDYEFDNAHETVPNVSTMGCKPERAQQKRKIHLGGNQHLLGECPGNRHKHHRRQKHEYQQRAQDPQQFQRRIIKMSRMSERRQARRVAAASVASAPAPEPGHISNTPPSTVSVASEAARSNDVISPAPLPFTDSATPTTTSSFSVETVAELDQGDLEEAVRSLRTASHGSTAAPTIVASAEAPLVPDNSSSNLKEAMGSLVIDSAQRVTPVVSGDTPSTTILVANNADSTELAQAMNCLGIEEKETETENENEVSSVDKGYDSALFYFDVSGDSGLRQDQKTLDLRTSRSNQRKEQYAALEKGIDEILEANDFNFDSWPDRKYFDKEPQEKNSSSWSWVKKKRRSGRSFKVKPAMNLIDNGTGSTVTEADGLIVLGDVEPEDGWDYEDDDQEHLDEENGLQLIS